MQLRSGQIVTNNHLEFKNTIKDTIILCSYIKDSVIICNYVTNAGG